MKTASPTGRILCLLAALLCGWHSATALALTDDYEQQKIEHWQPSREDADTAAAVASYEVDKDGVIKYKFWDKNSALEKAAKVQGLYEKDNDQKKDPITIITRRIVG